MLSQYEKDFYKSLSTIAEKNNCIVFTKVSLKDFAEVTSEAGKSFQTYFYKIAQKHIDFIICNKDLKILFAIELDDSSHQNQAAKKNDDFKNEFFRKIDIPLERVTKYNKNSNIDFIENMFNRHVRNK